MGHGKNYDNIDIVKLIKFAKNLNYPMRLLALGLVMHMSPRLIRAGESYAMAMLATNGIIAGCSQSNAFARAFLHHILEHMCTARVNHGEKVLFRQFVDDLRQSHRAPTPAALQTSMSKASATLSSMLIGAGCKISKNPLYLPTPPK